MRLYTIVLVLLPVAILSTNSVSQRHNTQEPPKMDEWKALEISLRGSKSVTPKNGFVPDESTAVNVAEAVAAAEYGEATIQNEKPFHARLYGNVWLVHGTLHPEGSYGGTAVVKLDKRDGKILFMIHQY